MKQLYGFVVKTGKTLRETHPVVQGVAFAIFVLTLAIMFFGIVFSPDTDRFLFLFPAVSTGKTGTEVRYLVVEQDENTRLGRFVDELVLGPQTPGYRPVFADTVRTRVCFIRGKDAYIDLSAGDTAFLAETTTPEQTFEIFKKNVFTNFRNLAKIYLYIDGIEVYAENPYADAGQPE